MKEKRLLQEAEAEKAALEAALVEAKAMEDRSTLTKQGPSLRRAAPPAPACAILRRAAPRRAARANPS